MAIVVEQGVVGELEKLCTVPLYSQLLTHSPLYPSTDTRHLIRYPYGAVHLSQPLTLQSIPHPCALKPNFKAPLPSFLSMCTLGLGLTSQATIMISFICLDTFRKVTYHKRLN